MSAPTKERGPEPLSESRRPVSQRQTRYTGEAGRSKRCGPARRIEMPAPITAEVGEMLREYGRRLSLGGGNPYRVRAYVRAADSLTALGEPLEDLIVEDRPTDVPGVGDAIAAMVTTMYRKGTYP